MPCNSKVVAVLVHGEQAAWLLEQLRARPELQDALMSAIVEEVRAALPDVTINLSDLIVVFSQPGNYNNSMTANLRNKQPTYSSSRYADADEINRMTKALGESLDSVASQLLAEMTRMEMEQAGFTVTHDQLDAEGTRVINWQVEVAA